MSMKNYQTCVDLSKRRFPHLATLVALNDAAAADVKASDDVDADVGSDEIDIAVLVVVEAADDDNGCWDLWAKLGM